jgi:hypothetical protein
MAAVAFPRTSVVYRPVDRAVFSRNGQSVDLKDRCRPAVPCRYRQTGCRAQDA